MAPKLPQRYIGDTPVPAIGFGCLNIAILLNEDSSGPEEEASCLRTLTAAADLGMTFWVTSNAYANNESLLGRWFKETGRRDEIFLATKFGNIRPSKIRPSTAGNSLDSKPETVIASCNMSLEALQTDHIDLYLQHRVDPETPIEKTVEAMVQLKNEGKIRYMGLSECSARTLQRACKVHPIAAAEMEFSPFAMEIESEQTNFLKTARELGVKILAYAPFSKGLFTGTIRKRADLGEKDWRLNSPRFSEENFPANIKLVELIEAIAKEKGCTPSQLLLAWILFQGEDFIPLPGTKQIKWLKENVEAFNVKFSKEDDQKIRKAIDQIGGVHGERYPVQMMKYCFGDSPELDSK